MPGKAKTKPATQQQRLKLQSVKKKQLFKKDSRAQKVAVKSPREHPVSPVKDEAAIKKKTGEFVRKFCSRFNIICYV